MLKAHAVFSSDNIKIIGKHLTNNKNEGWHRPPSHKKEIHKWNLIKTWMRISAHIIIQYTLRTKLLRTQVFIISTLILLRTLTLEYLAVMKH